MNDTTEDRDSPAPRVIGSPAEIWLNYGEIGDEIERLRAQCAAWKEVAEHQYGLLRAEFGGEGDYQVTGALDAWAAGRHPVLRPNDKDQRAAKPSTASDSSAAGAVAKGLR